MKFRRLFLAVFLTVAIICPLQVQSQANSGGDLDAQPSTPFSIALDTLQKQIGYKFQSVGLLRRAMTHASFSEENNKALSILGANVIQTAVSLQLLGKDIDISSKDLNRRISDVCNVESSCAVDGMRRLGLQKVVRVSPKTNSSSPAVVCGAFRAMVGAISVDTGKSDEAGNVFWNVHGGHIGRAIARTVMHNGLQLMLNGFCGIQRDRFIFGSQY